MSNIRAVSVSEITKLQAPNYAFGQKFTCNKNQTTNIDIAIPVKFALVGAEFWVAADHSANDYFDAYLIDVDNVLGMGEETVLGQFASKRHMKANHVHKMDLKVGTMILVDGLYFRFAYRNSQPDLGGFNVDGFVNFFGYNLTNTGV